jgi:hypothetical protein
MCSLRGHRFIAARFDLADAVGLRLERSVSWWLGDWWAFGECETIVEAKDWEGPEYQMCMDAASVCRKFETSRRHEVLSFQRPREVAALPPGESGALLNWCEETAPKWEKCAPSERRALTAAGIPSRQAP